MLESRDSKFHVTDHHVTFIKPRIYANDFIVFYKHEDAELKSHDKM